MSTYQSLKGLKVKYLSTATTGDRVIEGEIFYNSGGFAIASHIGLGAWSATSSLSTGRTHLCGSGTQTAAFAAGGLKPAAANETEEYNGSGWANGGNLNTARSLLAAAGSQTAGLAFGGIATTLRNESEEYNGSSWTEGDNLNTARRALAGAGTQTAGLAFGGSNPTTTEKNETETYNGSSWTEVANLNDARDFVAGLGTQTAALCISGESPSLVASVESWDGSSWTEVGDLNTARFGAAASGTTSAGLAFGGQSSTAVVGITESWDGTSWTELADLSTAREHLAGSLSASNPATLAFGGGDGPPFSDATEEFNISTSATTAGAWANSNNLNTARRGTNNGGCGIQTAALLAGGNSSQPGTTIIDNSEEYDGSSWTEGNNLNTARYNASGAGTQTAGLAVGGFKTDFPEAGETEEYNGTSWTAGNDNSTVRQEGSLAGSQTAALYAGGRAGSPTTYYANVEYYDGTNWTSAPANMPGSRAGGAGAGTQTAYITVGGVIPPGPPFSPTNTSLEWDGSSWTAGGDYLVSVFGAVGAGGIQTSALFAGSDSSPQNTHASIYDGTSFATNPSLATGRHDSGGLHGGTSTSTAGLVYSGPTGSVSAATEEFTGETTALRSAKTIDFD